MELSLVTNIPDFAAAAEQVGIERIMIDLERLGKAKRQAGTDSFLSNHQLEDIARVRSRLQKTEVVVRINSLHANSDHEIDQVIEQKASFVMLPYFHTLDEVDRFTQLVNNRAKTILLVETKAAVKNLSGIVAKANFDEVHIGLNDLSREMGCKLLFEPVCTNILNSIAETLNAKQVPFGIAGISRLSRRDLPLSPEKFLAEQVRLGASRGWLGRSFKAGIEPELYVPQLTHEMRLLRLAIASWRNASAKQLLHNRVALIDEIVAWKTRLELENLVDYAVAKSPA